ncbi:hypothetical protein HZS55_02455 [Halosimplex rubrum]|uniref:Uncharacterized protein n=1 Tax=Halosimplex rubrum TaxID=869889 RepID=A0A7D5TM02_9EURY|nr:hypothetical protein [Halosimplex rubrum]QLH76234.1 hypothetical protein HZS55_02455 [Halosimplex rubrum]
MATSSVTTVPEFADAEVGRYPARTLAEHRYENTGDVSTAVAELAAEIER